jgi:hypothetical protein
MNRSVVEQVDTGKVDTGKVDMVNVDMVNVDMVNVDMVNVDMVNVDMVNVDTRISHRQSMSMTPCLRSLAHEWARYLQPVISRRREVDDIANKFKQWQLDIIAEYIDELYALAILASEVELRYSGCTDRWHWAISLSDGITLLHPRRQFGNVVLGAVTGSVAIHPVPESTRYYPRRVCQFGGIRADTAVKLCKQATLATFESVRAD